MKYTLSVPKSIYACSKLRDMFYDNFATQNIKLITDKIKETDFNGIKYGLSNSGGVKSCDKNLTISKDKRPMLR
jgi:hypothetical protein